MFKSVSVEERAWKYVLQRHKKLDTDSIKNTWLIHWQKSASQFLPSSSWFLSIWMATLCPSENCLWVIPVLSFLYCRWGNCGQTCSAWGLTVSQGHCNSGIQNADTCSLYYFSHKVFGKISRNAWWLHALKRLQRLLNKNYELLHQRPHAWHLLAFWWMLG